MEASLNYPVLLMVTPSHPHDDAQEYVQFLKKLWSAGVTTQLAPLYHYAAAIVFYQGGDLQNGQIRTLHSLVNQHTPVLIINTSGRSSYSWERLAARNERVKYFAADGEAWRDVCFHFLGSLKQSLQQGDFSLLAISLNERQQKRVPAASV